MAEKVIKDVKPVKKAEKDVLDSEKFVHVASGKSVPGWKPSSPVEK